MEYDRTIPLFLLGIGTLCLVIGFYTIEQVVYIGMGWVVATFCYALLLEDTVRDTIKRHAEWRQLKRNTRLATKTQKKMEKVMKYDEKVVHNNN